MSPILLSILFLFENSVETSQLYLKMLIFRKHYRHKPLERRQFLLLPFQTLRQEGAQINSQPKNDRTKYSFISVKYVIKIIGW